MNKRNLQITGVLVAIVSMTLAVIIFNALGHIANDVISTVNSTTPIANNKTPNTASATPNTNHVKINANITATYLISKSGTKINPVIVDGDGFTAQCIKVIGSYVTVKNFIVENCKSHAILVLGNSVIVENNTVRFNVTENGKINCGAFDVQWGSGIKAERGSHDVIIRGNKVYENCGEGIASTMSYNVRIENNTVWDNFSVEIYVDNSYNVIVSNNVVYCTGIYLRNGKRPTGIVFAEESYMGWGTQRHDNSAINNRVNGCNAGISSWDSELSTGREIRLLIEGNRIFDTIGRSIELNTVNEDVVVRNNISDKPVFVRQPAGSIVIGNIEVIPTPSQSVIQLPTHTVTVTNIANPTSTP